MEYYLIKRNLIISILLLIQHNFIISRLVVYKKAFDIRRAYRSVPRHQPLTQNHRNTNHRVYLFFIIFVKLFEFYYFFLFFYLSIIIYFYSFNYWLLYNYTPYDFYFFDFGEGVGVEGRCVMHAWFQMLFYTLLTPIEIFLCEGLLRKSCVFLPNVFLTDLGAVGSATLSMPSWLLLVKFSCHVIKVDSLVASPSRIIC